MDIDSATGTTSMRATPFSEDAKRPEFMAALGLLPPYTQGDVKSAYRAKAMETHPDRGGRQTDFIKIHEAYKQAMEYVQVIGDRRKWIAEQVDCYLRQQEVAAAVERLGGRAKFEETTWLRSYVGDFVLLAERLRVIHLQNTQANDAFLSFLAEQPPRVPNLVELNLAGTRITDEGLQSLEGFDQLRRLDLSGTRVTSRGFRFVVQELPALEWVGVAGSGVDWLSRWRLSKLLRGREAERRRLKLLMPGI